jgi:hypothetical protein
MDTLDPGLKTIVSPVVVFFPRLSFFPTEFRQPAIKTFYPYARINLMVSVVKSNHRIRRYHCLPLRQYLYMPLLFQKTEIAKAVNR